MRDLGLYDGHKSKDVFLGKQYRKFVYMMLKRLFDIMFSLAGLIICAPVIFALAVAIKVESRGVCFYRQERMGRNGRSFTIVKLRTMQSDAEKHGIRWAERLDSRVTRIGRLLRRSRLDELPQFLNILKGDMSLVGPRPERPYFMRQFIREIPGYEDRMKVKPGLTGWAQVNGGYDLSPGEKLEKDIFYIDNQSLGMDFKIILKTIYIVLSGKGAR